MDQRLLHVVAVLVLIHQDFFKLAAQLVGCGRRGSFSLVRLFQKHLQRVMLQVPEIHQVLFLLGFLVTVMKFSGQSQQHPHRPRGPL